MSIERITETETIVVFGLVAAAVAVIFGFSGISARNRGVEPVTGGEGGGANAEKWLRWDSGAYLM